jgi:hypothetical protein
LLVDAASEIDVKLYDFAVPVGCENLEMTLAPFNRFPRRETGVPRDTFYIRRRD